jgi:drug/metabolite transporter (DMT)-like permease
MQLVLTAALVGPLLGEKVTMRQWLGLVVANKLALGHRTFVGMGWLFMALLGITFCSLYQKRFCPHMDPRSGTCVQFLVAAALLYPLSLVFETGVVDWASEFVAALVYVSVVLSLIAISLPTIMIRRGEASRVSGLFFLVAPCAALLGYVILPKRRGL